MDNEFLTEEQKVETDELLFMRLLLMHGGDPEPDNPNWSMIYTEWFGNVQATIAELNREKTTAGFSMMEEFETWLGKRGLAYVSRDDE